MPRAFIGVGSNIEPEVNIRAALGLLRERVRVTRVSTFYRTDPIARASQRSSSAASQSSSRPEQPSFRNGVFEVETSLSPADLKQVLHDIEAQLHRRRTSDKYAPRTIDLDLLLYDDLVLASDGLTLPDPDIEERAFLAIPLCELAPDGVLPGSGRTLCEIAAGFRDGPLQPLETYTRELRSMIGDGLPEG